MKGRSQEGKSGRKGRRAEEQVKETEIHLLTPLAMIYARLKDYEAAEKFFKKAVRLMKHPEEATLVVNTNDNSTGNKG